MKKSSVDCVNTQFESFGGDLERTIKLQSGQSFGPLTIAYETYGELNRDKSNAILVFHALSGSQHAAGLNTSLADRCNFWTEECYLGWWDSFIGPGRALNTSQYFIICANYIGGCYGSSGPSSINPQTNAPYGASFPRIGVNDIVDTQLMLIKRLGIEQLHAVVGPSLGGMLALNLATRYPELVRLVVSIASGLEVSILQRLLRFEQIRAIEEDQNFAEGDYYNGPPPDQGLALARMIAHKAYISLATLEKRAKGEIVQADDSSSRYQISHPVESYMLHHGQKFVSRFDANTYLRIAEAWQRYNLLRDAGSESYKELFARCRNQKFLIFSIDSDVCFYPEEQTKLEDALKAAEVSVSRITVHSEKGHDTFLLEPGLFMPYLDYALMNMS